MLAANAPGLNGDDLCDYLENMDREEITKLNQETGPANIQADPCVESAKGSAVGGAIGLGVGAAFIIAGAPLAVGIPFGALFVGIAIFLGGAQGYGRKGQTIYPWLDRCAEKESERYARLRGKVTMITYELDGSQLDKKTRIQLDLAKTYFQSTVECYNREIDISVSHNKYA